MSNDYFTSFSLLANTKADAADINSRTENIEAGFDKLPAPHASAPTTKGFSEVFVIEDGTARTHALAIGQNQDQSTVYAADSGAADAYVVTLSPAPTAYTAGMKVVMKATNANTGASTINVNSLGAKSIVTPKGAALSANAIGSGMICQLMYDGTNFQLIGDTEAGTDQTISDNAYGAGWDGDTNGASKNAIYDKIETLVPGNYQVVTATGGSSAKVTIGENEILGRKTGGDVESISAAELKTITGHMTDLSDDSSPQLGGNLDINGNDIYDGGDLVMFVTDQLTLQSAGTNNEISFSGMIAVRSSEADMVPEYNGLIDLGVTGARWKKGWFVDLHSTNAATDDSDERKKEQIQPMQDDILTFLSALRPVTYRLKDQVVEAEVVEKDVPVQIEVDEPKETVVYEKGHYIKKQTLKKVKKQVFEIRNLYDESGQVVGQHKAPVTEKKLVEIHPKTETKFPKRFTGLVAQEVEQTIIDLGYDLNDFNCLHYDEENDEYGLRYGQFVSMLIKGWQEHEATIKTLIQKVEGLENATVQPYKK